MTAPAPIPWTQEHIDTLLASIASGGGVETIAFGDRSVRFATLKDRLALLAEMQAAVNPPTLEPGYRLASHSKGV